MCLWQVEAELQELEEEEAQEYLEGLGVQEGGLRSLIAATYKQLGLLTYFTTGMLPAITLSELLNSHADVSHVVIGARLAWIKAGFSEFLDMVRRTNNKSQTI